MWKWLDVSGRVSRCDAQLTRTSWPYSTRRSMDCSASAAHLQHSSSSVNPSVTIVMACLHACLASLCMQACMLQCATWCNWVPARTVS